LRASALGAPFTELRWAAILLAVCNLKIKFSIYLVTGRRISAVTIAVTIMPTQKIRISKFPVFMA
jgi:hypothetical protein